MEKQYFAIIDKNNKIEHFIGTEIDVDTSFNVLSEMYKESLIIKLDNYIKDSFFENSYFYNGKIYPPKPFPSWILTDSGWSAPENYPNNENLYFWDEEKKNWQQYTGTIS